MRKIECIDANHLYIRFRQRIFISFTNNLILSIRLNCDLILNWRNSLRPICFQLKSSVTINKCIKEAQSCLFKYLFKHNYFSCELFKWMTQNTITLIGSFQTDFTTEWLNRILIVKRIKWIFICLHDLSRFSIDKSRLLSIIFYWFSKLNYDKIT